jgi:hypothetical protein
MVLKTIGIGIAMAFFISGNVSALDFSADMVSTVRGGGSFAGKTFVSGDKSRMEAAGAITITRIDKGVTWMIVPEQNMFIEQPIDVSKVAGTTDKIPGELERSLLGREAVGKISADKYRVAYTENGRKVAVLQWIDPASGIPVKTASEDGGWSVEYKNLVVGAQPDSLFEVPQQYSKMAMPNMADIMAAAKRPASHPGRQEEE